MKMPSLSTRKYAYVVLVALAAVLAGYGVFGAEDSARWLALASALLGLGPGLALGNLADKPSEDA